jgi:hypothetical protein
VILMGKVLLKIGADKMFSRLDTITNAQTDIVILSALPDYAKSGTSQVTGVVQVFDADGVKLLEVMGGEIGALSSVGSFAYGATSNIQIAFAKGEFADADEAMEAVADYTVIFELQDSATYVTSAYDVKIFDRLDGKKTFDSVIIGDEQLLALMKSHIGIADLSQRGMNPFRLEILPKIRI